MMGPYRDVPTLARQLEYADREIAALRERVKTLEQQCSFRDQQLETIQRLNADLDRSLVSARETLRLERESWARQMGYSSGASLTPPVMTSTGTIAGSISTTIRVGEGWFSERANRFGAPRAVSVAPVSPPPQPLPQLPDGFGELEQRTQAVRDARAEQYKPAPRDKTRFDFLEVD